MDKKVKKRSNDFGYKDVSSRALRDILDDIQNDYAVDIKVEIQPTHTFDFNAQDALSHRIKTITSTRSSTW